MNPWDDNGRLSRGKNPLGDTSHLARETSRDSDSYRHDRESNPQGDTNHLAQERRLADDSDHHGRGIDLRGDTHRHGRGTGSTDGTGHHCAVSHRAGDTCRLGLRRTPRDDISYLNPSSSRADDTYRRPPRSDPPDDIGRRLRETWLWTCRSCDYSSQRRSPVTVVGDYNSTHRGIELGIAMRRLRVRRVGDGSTMRMVALTRTVNRRSPSVAFRSTQL
jgi:hypothetical protein